jgi:hypothetical protein
VLSSEATLYTQTLMPFVKEYLESVIDDFSVLMKSANIDEGIERFTKSYGLIKRQEIEKEYKKNNK